MAIICRHYRMSPIDFRQLTLGELGALTEHMDDELRAAKRA